MKAVDVGLRMGPSLNSSFAKSVDSSNKVTFVENVLISRCVPLARPLLQPAALGPVRVVSLAILANSLLDIDMETVVTNFFGGSHEIVSMLLDRNKMLSKL